MTEQRYIVIERLPDGRYRPVSGYVSDQEASAMRRVKPELSIWTEERWVDYWVERSKNDD